MFLLLLYRYAYYNLFYHTFIVSAYDFATFAVSTTL